MAETNDNTETEDQTCCVIWYRVRCPYCYSANISVTNSKHAPYRYHKCKNKNCGKTFQSFEANHTENKPPLISTIRQSDKKNQQKNPSHWENRAKI